MQFLCAHAFFPLHKSSYHFKFQMNPILNVKTYIYIRNVKHFALKWLRLWTRVWFMCLLVIFEETCITYTHASMDSKSIIFQITRQHCSFDQIYTTDHWHWIKSFNWIGKRITLTDQYKLRIMTLILEIVHIFF